MTESNEATGAVFTAAGTLALGIPFLCSVVAFIWVVGLLSVEEPKWTERVKPVEPIKPRSLE